MENISSISPSATTVTAARPARSEQAQSRPIVQPVGKALPPEVKQDAPVSEEQVKQAVEQLNKQFGNENIGFSYEKRLNMLLVKVTDKATGAVVKEFPSKDFVEHKVAMQAMVGVILDKQA